MPIDTISGPMWLATLASYPTDPATDRMKRILTDILNESVDPVIGMILDRHAREILR